VWDRAGGRRVGRVDRHLQIVKTTGRIVGRDVFGIDRAVRLLHHGEILMTQVGGESVVGQRRTGELERTRRERKHVGDARIGTQGVAEPGASGAQQEFSLRLKFGIAAGEVHNRNIRRDGGCRVHIRGRQRGVQRLIREICADEVFSAVGGGGDLVLMCLGK
jgi:hypothetical protein